MQILVVFERSVQENGIMFVRNQLELIKLISDWHSSNELEESVFYKLKYQKN